MRILTEQIHIKYLEEHLAYNESYVRMTYLFICLFVLYEVLARLYRNILVHLGRYNKNITDWVFIQHFSQF